MTLMPFDRAPDNLGDAISRTDLDATALIDLAVHGGPRTYSFRQRYQFGAAAAPAMSSIQTMRESGRDGILHRRNARKSGLGLFLDPPR
jgi:hypothetical protein